MTEPNWSSWERSSSGSGAPWNEGPWQDIFMSQWAGDAVNASLNQEAPIDEEYSSMISTGMTYGAGELPYGATMSPKVPPAFDGRGSWFAFEELVFDWEDSCTLDKELRGPALKNRLSGEAMIYKPMLDRDRLKQPDAGVEYFLSTLRPHFVKRCAKCFLTSSLPVYAVETRTLGNHALDSKIRVDAKALVRCLDGLASD